MSKKEKYRRGKDNEKLSAWLIESTYLTVITDPPSIRCDPPVEVRPGKFKSVTYPDILVEDPKFDRYMYIEATSGKGNNGHKAAQQMVVDAAGEEHYFLMTGDHTKRLFEVCTPENRLNLLFEWFGWED